MTSFSSLAYLQELASTSKSARLTVTSADGLVARIRDGILSGDIKPGDFLGSERDIADHYAVSRNTAREALRSLAAQGAVEIRVGVKGGATVAGGDPEVIGQTLALQHCLTGVPYDEVLEIHTRAPPAAAACFLISKIILFRPGAVFFTDRVSGSDRPREIFKSIVLSCKSQPIMITLRMASSSFGIRLGNVC